MLDVNACCTLLGGYAASSRATYWIAQSSSVAHHLRRLQACKIELDAIILV